MERVNREGTGTHRQSRGGEAWKGVVENAVERGAEDVRSWLRTADAWTRQMTEHKPLLALGVALAAGYVIGRIFSIEED
jgi:hypothetical protein